ncbi:hypothetical protein [Formosa sp. A9]|uniref:hypothetical protein n=1 Tax=Formosa sp. A9 TaxID=3442641 RepID=UPI003EB8AA5C
MKTKIIGISLALGALAIAGQTKVTICHSVYGVNPHTITVAAPAAIAHFLQHPNDTFGSCGDNGGEEQPQG